jgi:membrane protein DedA with SNARE-associated domain/membrane-associated phospholipid phosphatase
MEHFLQPLMEFLRQHPFMGITAAFLIAFIESLPILGTLFPGSVSMTAIGVLVGSGVLPPIATLASAIIGAFAGDCLGFWLGDRYREKIRSLWPFQKLSKYLNYTEKFFTKHGGKSIIIGRFVGPTRAAMPLIAGILRYRWKQFIPAALFAAISWSLIYVAPGIALGALAMEFSEQDMTKVFLAGITVIVGLWLIFWILQYFFKRLSHFINRSIQKMWRRLNQPKPGIIVLLIRNQLHPQDFHQLKLTLLFFLYSFLFLFIWFDKANQGVFTLIDQPLFYLTQSFRSSSFDNFWSVISILGTPEALFISSVAAGLALTILYHQWRIGTHLMLVGFLSATAIEIIKKIYYSPRPQELVHVDPSSSFPSGHAAISVAVLGFLAFLTAHFLPRAWRHFIYTVFTLLIVLVGLSRLFLGQHWFTDILGGWFLGLSILMLVTISFRRMPKKHKTILLISPQKWLSLLSITTLIPWLGAGILTFEDDFRDSQPVWPMVLLNYPQWWQQPLQSTPIYRRDRFGHLAQPFNVQWAATLPEINNFLMSRGWRQVTSEPRWKSVVNRFTSLEPQHNNQLLPWLYQNKPPQVFFIKNLTRSPDILELRLWNSGAKFADCGVPLWVGILTYHTPPEKLLRFPHHYIHLQSGGALVESSQTSNGFEFQLFHVAGDLQPKKVRALHWDGNVYILKTIEAASNPCHTGPAVFSAGGETTSKTIFYSFPDSPILFHLTA